MNTSRGGIINEKDLSFALKNKIIQAAAIDVFEMEPYQGILSDYNNCLLTSHMGSMTTECRARMEIEATQEVIRFASGQSLESEVPPEEYSTQRLREITEISP